MKHEKKTARRERLAHKKHHTVRGESVVGQARHRWFRVGPRKARLLADLVRDKSVAEARQTLAFALKPSVQPALFNLLKSAVSNVDRAEYSEEDLEKLVVGEICVDSGPIVKRYRPRAMGRMNMIRKRTCHVTLRLTDPLGVGGRPAAGGQSAPAPALDEVTEVEG